MARPPIRRKTQLKEVAPAPDKLPEVGDLLTPQQAMTVIGKVAETGDLLEASKAVRGVSFAEVMIWIRSKPEWVNALDTAMATYAQAITRNATMVAEEPIPWAGIQGWDIERQKLYLDAWHKRQKLRVDTMAGLASRLAPKPAPTGTAVSVNVDASRREPLGAYATTLQAVEQLQRSKLIDHKEYLHDKVT